MFMLARSAARKASSFSPSPAPASIDQSIGQRRRRQGRRQFGQFREPIQCPLSILSKQGVRQGLFRRKKPIERAESRPGTGGDLRHCDRIIALFPECCGSGLQDGGHPQPTALALGRTRIGGGRY